MHRNFHKSQRQDVSILSLGNEWNEGWKIRVFETIWQAYDKLMEFYKVNGKNAKDEIENQITSDLVLNANDVKYDVLEGFPPTETRKLQFHNQPPDEKKSNDIGVFLGVDNKPVFIFESKKIESLSEKQDWRGILSYQKDLQAYLDEYYGSHLPESALIAYLHIGTTDKMFELIKTSIKTKLKQFSKFASRPHKTSKHKKTISSSANKDFLCHHLIFEMF